MLLTYRIVFEQYRGDQDQPDRVAHAHFPVKVTNLLSLQLMLLQRSIIIEG